MTRMEENRLWAQASNGDVPWWSAPGEYKRLPPEERLRCALRLHAEKDALQLSPRAVEILDFIIRCQAEKIAASKIGYPILSLRGSERFEIREVEQAVRDYTTR